MAGLAILASAVAPALAPVPVPAAMIEDQRGRPVEIEAPAGRVAILNTALWPYLTLDEGERHIAAATSLVRRVVDRGLLGRIYPGARSIPTGISLDGTPMPDIEGLLAARPDAVLQWTGDNDAIFIEPLERVGLPVLGMIHMRREEDYYDTNRMLGAVAARPDRASWLEQRYRRAALELARDRPHPARPVRVLYLWQMEPIAPVDGSSLYSKVIARAGGENVAAELTRFQSVDIERVLAWNPEIVLLFCCQARNPADFFQNRLWAGMEAVKNRRVYKVPIAGTRFADMVEGPLFARWLAELMFPEMGRALRRQMQDAYAEIYGYALSEDEIDQALQIDANRGAAGYDRFER